MANRELVIGGIYKHFKGKVYKVIGVARHSETLEKMVVYERLEGESDLPEKIWVRPYDMFLEDVTRDGKTFPRFEFLKDYVL